MMMSTMNESVFLRINDNEYCRSSYPQVTETMVGAEAVTESRTTDAFVVDEDFTVADKELPGCNVNESGSRLMLTMLLLLLRHCPVSDDTLNGLLPSCGLCPILEQRPTLESTRLSAEDEGGTGGLERLISDDVCTSWSLSMSDFESGVPRSPELPTLPRLSSMSRLVLSEPSV